MLLILAPKTISIIGATMFNIVATRIIIVFVRIGVVFRRSKIKRFRSACQTMVDSYFMGNAILRSIAISLPFCLTFFNIKNVALRFFVHEIIA